MNIQHLIRTATFTCLAVCATGQMAFAHPPIVDITGPSNTQLTCNQSFPFATEICFTVQSEDISRTKNIFVGVNGTALAGFPTGTPRVFDATTNSCTATMLALTSSCSVSGDTATGCVPYSVPSAGSYTFRVTANWGDPLGVAEKTVIFSGAANCQENTHQPAPPAIANAYIKAQGYDLDSKVHGCILKQIALNHAQDSKYGPKSGPYDEALIHQDVDAYRISCAASVARKQALVASQRQKKN